MDELRGKKVAILVTDGFEQIEMTSPRDALRAAGAEPVLVAPKERVIASKHHQRGDTFRVDVQLANAVAAEYAALVLPGGVANPDALRQLPEAVRFVRSFAGRPIAAICHGPWTLIEADLVRGRRVTSYPSLKTDLKNAGAEWVDEEVVVDDGLVTSRKPDDLPAFNRKLIEKLGEGRHTSRGRKPATDARPD